MGLQAALTGKSSLNSARKLYATAKYKMSTIGTNMVNRSVSYLPDSLIKPFRIPHFDFIAGGGVGGIIVDPIEAKVERTRLFLSLVKDIKKFRFTKQIKDESLQVAYAKAMAIIGEKEQALYYCAKAYKSISGFHYYRKSDLISEIIQSLEHIGEKEKIYEFINEMLTEEIESRDPKFLIAKKTVTHALTLLLLGQKQKALEIITCAEDLIYENAPHNLLLILIELGEKKKAMDLFDRVYKEASEKGELKDIEDDIFPIMINLKEIGAVEDVLSIAGKMINQDYRDEYFSASIEILCKKGEIERAIQILDNIHDPSYKTEAISFIEIYYLERGDRERAKKFVATADEINKKEEYEDYLHLANEAIVRVFLRLGEIDQAVRYIEKYSINEAKKDVVEALISRNEIEKAFELAKKYGEQFLLVAEAQIRNGEINQALRIAEEHGDQEIKFKIKLSVLQNLIQQDPQIISDERLDLLKQSTIERMESQDNAIRLAALQYYLEMGWLDHEVRDLLADILCDNVYGILEVIDRLVRLDSKYADDKINEFLAIHPEFMNENIEYLAGISERYGLDKIKNKVAEFQRAKDEEEQRLEQEAMIKKREEENRKAVSQRIADVAEKIAKKLSNALAVDIEFVTNSFNGDDGTYGEIGLIAQDLKKALLNGEKLAPTYLISVMEGESIEEAQERIMALNFLAHHEFMHRFQIRKNIDKPVIGAYNLINLESASAQANEILLDRLAFDAARDIYVYRGGDFMYGKGVREVIAINAYLTLSKIYLRNIELKKHDYSPENIARFIAVLSEISQSSNIPLDTKSELINLMTVFKNIIITGQDKAKDAELSRLINEYRRIFIANEGRLESYI